MKIAIGNDHAGTSYKFIILKHLESQNIKVYNFFKFANFTINFFRVPSLNTTPTL